MCKYIKWTMHYYSTRWNNNQDCIFFHLVALVHFTIGVFYEKFYDPAYFKKYIFSNTVSTSGFYLITQKWLDLYDYIWVKWQDE